MAGSKGIKFRTRRHSDIDYASGLSKYQSKLNQKLNSIKRQISVNDQEADLSDRLDRFVINRPNNRPHND